MGRMKDRAMLLDQVMEECLYNQFGDYEYVTTEGILWEIREQWYNEFPDGPTEMDRQYIANRCYHFDMQFPNGHPDDAGEPSV
jgi:hypothetical protein